MRSATLFLMIIVSILIRSVSAAPSADSTQHRNDAPSLRGVEHEEKFASDPWRLGLNVLCFIPRETISGVLYLGGRGLNAATDPEFVEFISKFLYIYERKAGWYPLVMVDSEFRPEAGVNFFCKDEQFSSSFSTKYADEHRWRSRMKFTFGKRDAVWSISLWGEIAEEDDRIYYGIGAEPLEDARSHFLPSPTEEEAEYMQQRQKVVLEVDVELSEHLNLMPTLMYSHRKVSNPSLSGNQIVDVFNLSELTGINQAIELAYLELAGIFDSRSRESSSFAGVAVEAYFGYAGGIQNEIEYLRGGSDIEWFIPVLRKNRLIVPHLAFNMIENLNDGIPLPFSEYPHHPTFRGVSSRRLLRIDNLSLVPSVEYRWPLSHSINAHLFTDALIVAESVQDFALGNAPWAAGFGMRIRIQRTEIGGLSAAIGSEGIRVLLSLGATDRRPTRSEWK